MNKIFFHQHIAGKKTNSLLSNTSHRVIKICMSVIYTTVKPGYNDFGLYDTSPKKSDMLWYQLIRHC